MNKNQNSLVLAFKGVLYIYLPIILLTYIIYELIFKIDLDFSWDRVIMYGFIIGISTAMNYTQRIIEEDVEDFRNLKSSIIKDRWEVIEQRENQLIVKPKFDFPLRLLIDGKVQINYCEGKAIIRGPWYYTKNIVKDINGKFSIWKNRIRKVVFLIFIIILFSMPILNDLGFFWEIKKSRHESFIKNIQVIEIDSEDVIGNSVENTNNYGLGVENEDYIFYIENDLSLVRVNKDYQDKKYLIQKPSGTGISRLNLAGDWIFYTSGENLNRIRIDGSQNETIYELGYLLDIHMKDNFLYFINYSDNFNVYRMDINGMNLERFLKVDASDIALYGDKMIFSHDYNGKSNVESISLNSSERTVELETLANNLVKWDGYYYFIGEGYKLYKNKDGGITAPQILVDDKVSSYIITDAGIFYSLHSENAGYPGQDIFKVDLDGTESTLVLDTERVEGFTKLGDFIIFHSTNNDLEPRIKKLNIFTNDIEVIK